MLNDYLILDLIRQGDDHALKLMYDKYSPLIRSYINSLGPNDTLSFEDYFQEGLLCLHKAISIFDDSYNKTFTRFFELILKRRLQHIIYSDNKRKEVYMTDEKIDTLVVYEPTNSYYVCLDDLSDFEKQVYHYVYIKQYSINKTANKCNVSTKNIYNAIARLKRKLDKNNIS